MLKKLNIINGELSLEFDPLNTRYTVNMKTDDQKLEIEYEIKEKDKISIFNNEITNEVNEVVITVYNEKEIMSYYLEVYPNKEEQVTKVEDYFTSLEIKNKEKIPEYIAPLIATTCFLLILFFFAILFKKKKKC